MNLFFSVILMLIFSFGSLYYFIICISFLLTWIRPLYGTPFFNTIMKITEPFRKLFSGRLILWNFDIGSTLGLFLYGYLLSVIYNLAMIL